MKGYFKGELRPCPFCGDSVEVEDVGGYEASCSNCGLLMWEITKKDLSETWNNRPAFDEAIDVLIKTERSMDCHDRRSIRIKGSVMNLTGLNYGQALEIYHDRQGETK
jgi:transcription elongation factor Elf1